MLQGVINRRRMAMGSPVPIGTPCWARSRTVAASLTPIPPGREEAMPAVPERR
jgi:hypothetical protein